MIRQPIVSVLGHVDHGKTTLLDKIRGTAVVSKEAGAITQAVGATIVPAGVLKRLCGHLLTKFRIELKIPGLLILDTPGHAAFTSIRKRGSSIADLAILVVDVNEGFRPQTDESLRFLKEFRTPFLVAATKIDKIPGWIANKDMCFFESYQKQPEHVKEAADNAIYRLIGQLSERGFECERYDRIDDFKKQIAIIPSSGITGEGIADLLVLLGGLAQNFLKDRLRIEQGTGKGTVLEVKELRGLGITADVILYDGEIRKGDYLVVGGHSPVVTKIRALLMPRPLKELRVEKEFEQIESVTAAAGIKVSAPGMENIVAGSPIRAVRTEGETGPAKEELQKEVSEIEIETSADGVTLRADTLGSLEALIHMLKERGIPIRKAEVGPPTRKDIMEMEAVKDRYKKILFVFNIKIPPGVQDEARGRNMKLIHSDVIYKLFEDYDKWVKEEKEKERQEKLASITLPGKVKLLPGLVFRQSDPAVVGVEVLAGTVKPGVSLLRKDGKEIGYIKEMQSEGETVDKAREGDKVALSITGPTVGRQIKEGDELTVKISERDLAVLTELGMKDEIELAKEALKK